MWFSKKLSANERVKLEQTGSVKIARKTAETLLNEPNLWIVVLRFDDVMTFTATTNPVAFLQHVNKPLADAKFTITQSDMPEDNEPDYMLMINKGSSFMFDKSNVIYQSFIDSGKGLASATNSSTLPIKTKVDFAKFVNECMEMDDNDLPKV